MKNIKFLIKSLFSLSLIALLIVSCEDDEYEAPGSFTDLSITWTSGASSARESEVNRFFSFMDLSAGAESSQWIIPSNAYFLEGPIPNNLDNHDAYIVNPGDTISKDKTVHVLWKKGDSLTKVRYYGVFKDSTSFRFNKYYDTDLRQDVEDTIKTVRINGKWIADYTFIVDVYDTVVAVPEVRYLDNSILDHKTVNTVTVNFGDKLVFEDLSGLQADNNARPNTTRWRMHSIEEDEELQTNALNKSTVRKNLRDRVIDTIPFNKLGEFRVELKVSRERTERLKQNEEIYDIPTIFKVVPLTVPLNYVGTIEESDADLIQIELSHKIQPLTENISSGFSVKVDGVSAPIASVARNSTGSKLLIALVNPLTPDDASKNVVVSYNGGSIIKSFDERSLEAFSNVSVKVYEPTPMILQGSIMESASNELELTFGQAINPATIIGSLNPAKGFTVTVNGTAATIQSVSVNSVNPKVLNIALIGGVYRNDLIKVSYAAPGDIRSIGDGRIANFGPLTVVMNDDDVLNGLGNFEGTLAANWVDAGSNNGGSINVLNPAPIVAVKGTQALQLMGGDGSKSVIASSATFSFDASKTYVIKFKRYIKGTTTSSFGKFIIGGKTFNDNFDLTKLDQWVDVEIEFSPSATGDSQFKLQTIPAGVKEIYYDNLIIQVKETRP